MAAQDCLNSARKVSLYGVLYFYVCLGGFPVSRHCYVFGHLRTSYEMWERMRWEYWLFYHAENIFLICSRFVSNITNGMWSKARYPTAKVNVIPVVRDVTVEVGQW